jgi:hypothetical protein
MRSTHLQAIRALLVGLVAAAVLAIAGTSAAAGPPAAEPGTPGCQGRDTASFAQDWKTFGFEPAGVGPLARFYGGSNPAADWLQSERYADCAAP